MSNEAKKYRLDRSCVLADHIVMSPIEVVAELNALAKRIEELEAAAPSVEAGAVPDGWRAILNNQLEAQKKHYSDMASPASSGNGVFGDERLMTEGVIQGIEYCIEALSEAPTPPARAEPKLGELLKIAAELLDAGWFSDDCDEWPLQPSVVNQAAKDKERRRLMAIRLRSIWDKAKGASAGGLDKDLAAIKERFSECHRRLCSPDNCVLDGVDCVLDFDKKRGAQ